MTFPFNAYTIVTLIVPPCIMLLVSLALWLFAGSTMRASLPMRTFASVVALVGIGLDLALLDSLFGSYGWIEILYQFFGSLFFVSTLCALFRFWVPVKTVRPSRVELRTTIRLRPKKVRVYKNPKGRKPRRGRTAFDTSSVFTTRKC